MKVTKYQVIIVFTLFDRLFKIDDEIFISDSYHCMDGTFDYARKVFDGNGEFLGRIRDSYFREIKYLFKE